MRISIRFWVLVVLASVRLCSAQALSVGGLSNADSFSLVEPFTAIDLSHPATASGNLTTATVIWNTGGSPCNAAVKIKVFHPFRASYELVAERGPFAVAPGTLTFALTPPIPVEAGDLIGFAQLKRSTQCGGGRFSSDTSGIHSAYLPGDATGTVTLCDPGASPYLESVSVQASGAAEVYGGTVTGAGSAHGAAGSNFKTSMQLLNTGSATARGRLVFHPMGVPGSAADPSLAYTLAPGEAKSYDDVVVAIGTTGLGSIDVMTQASPVPLVVTRVFNDAGADGTAGFSEPLVRPGDPAILQSDDSSDFGFFVAPPDLSRFRVNFGVRSFSQGAKILIQSSTPGGGGASTTRTYLPDVFDQRAANDFAGGTVGGGAIVEVVVLEGSAIVYMVTVDNKTNDTSIQIADRRRS